MDSLGERLKRLRNSLSLTAVTVREKTNIADLGRFEKDERKPSIDSILALAKFYNVSVDWLLTGEDKYSDFNITTDEFELLKEYKRLDKIDQERILERIKTLIEVKEDMNRRIIDLSKHTRSKAMPATLKDSKDYMDEIEQKVYDLEASAGLGNYLYEGESSFQMLTFESNEILRRADFGIRISGNSMEPLINDGDIVWVKEQVQIENGQIGIFILDGEAYCKKLHIDYKKGIVELISLNKKYEPKLITKDSDLRTVGRVLL